MVAVGFEPTPSRTSALNWRLGPLGQTTSPSYQLLSISNLNNDTENIKLNFRLESLLKFDKSQNLIVYVYFYS